MKKILLILLMSILIAGCLPASPKNKCILAKINNYEITIDEFEEQFKESAYSRDNTLEARKEFLKVLVDRKLILQDAQRKGLDKKREFLKMIEKFWEQSLLKLALEQKSQEIAASVEVKDNQKGQDQLMRDWLSDLEKKAEIWVNTDLLK